MIQGQVRETKMSLDSIFLFFSFPILDFIYLLNIFIDFRNSSSPCSNRITASVTSLLYRESGAALGSLLRKAPAHTLLLSEMLCEADVMDRTPVLHLVPELGPTAGCPPVPQSGCTRRPQICCNAQVPSWSPVRMCTHSAVLNKTKIPFFKKRKLDLYFLLIVFPFRLLSFDSGIFRSKAIKIVVGWFIIDIIKKAFNVPFKALYSLYLHFNI